MKFNSTNWEKNKKRTLFFMWPSLISSVLMIFVVPIAVDTPSTLALLMPWLMVLVFVPFTVVEVRRYKAEAAREKREMQDKYDAEDKAMFGKPLRELEL